MSVGLQSLFAALSDVATHLGNVGPEFEDVKDEISEFQQDAKKLRAEIRAIEDQSSSNETVGFFSSINERIGQLATELKTGVTAALQTSVGPEVYESMREQIHKARQEVQALEEKVGEVAKEVTQEGELFQKDLDKLQSITNSLLQITRDERDDARTEFEALRQEIQESDTQMVAYMEKADAVIQAQQEEIESLKAELRALRGGQESGQEQKTRKYSFRPEGAPEGMQELFASIPKINNAQNRIMGTIVSDLKSDEKVKKHLSNSEIREKIKEGEKTEVSEILVSKIKAQKPKNIEQDDWDILVDQAHSDATSDILKEHGFDNPHLILQRVIQ